MSKRSFSFSNNPLLGGPALDERRQSSVPYKEIPISALEADPNQPRQTFDQDRLAELSESIRMYGVLSPILVRPGKLPGRYQIVSGERRFRAAQLAGLASMPAIVSSNEEGDSKTLAIQLVENIQRADLTPLERAHAIGALRDGHSLSIRDIAEKLGISKSAVQRSLEILELPDDLLNALREGAAESKVLLLSKIADESERAGYLKDLDTLTRSELEKSIERGDKSSTARPVSGDKAISAEDLRISDELQRGLGMRVRLLRSRPEAMGGKVVIDFSNEDDLQIIFRKLIADE
jgi:ParB family chromosome partitioning protein